MLVGSARKIGAKLDLGDWDVRFRMTKEKK